MKDFFVNININLINNLTCFYTRHQGINIYIYIYIYKEDTKYVYTAIILRLTDVCLYNITLRHLVSIIGCMYQAQ